MHLKRKARRNVVKSVNRVERIKRLRYAPSLKNIDVQAIKEEFAKKKAEEENA